MYKSVYNKRMDKWEGMRKEAMQAILTYNGVHLRIACMALKGYDIEEISEELDMSYEVVNRHFEMIFWALAAENDNLKEYYEVIVGESNANGEETF
jgi:hypothetical protein